MNVLVVDDDPVTRRLIAAGLERLGYTVTPVGDGEAAWVTLGTIHFPMVITDWMMPGVDGIELCRRIRSRHAADYTYVIVLTSLEGKPRYLEAMEAGADDFLTKPVDLDQLKARLHAAGRILRLEHHVRDLEKLLPICSYCKRIRQDAQTWQPVEQYLEDQTASALSHGICPDCYRTHVQPQLDALGGG